MTEPFLLAEIQELGRRVADVPGADAVEWSGMWVGDDDMRAIHAALHPSLALAAVAGYEPDGVLLVPPAGADVLDVVLSPRIAGLVPADLVLDLGAAPARGAPVDVVGALVGAQDDVVEELAFAIAGAHQDAGPTLTGLVSVLDPALWDFPEKDEGSGTSTEALRDLGRPIAAAALRNRAGLAAFLTEEATGRLLDGDELPSVQRTTPISLGAGTEDSELYISRTTTFYTGDPEAMIEDFPDIRQGREVAYPIVVGSTTWTAMPAAETPFGGSRQRYMRADLRHKSWCCMSAQVVAAGHTSAILKIQYTTDMLGSGGWANLTSSASIALTGYRQSNDGLIPSGAKGSVLLRCAGDGGDGIVSPAVHIVALHAW